MIGRRLGVTSGYRSIRSRIAAPVSGLLIGLLAVVMVTPTASAFSPFRSPFTTQTCGGGTGSGYTTFINTGTTSVGTWTQDNSAGTESADADEADAGGTNAASSEVMQVAWLSMGGPQHGYCFGLSSASGSVTYTWTNPEFNVYLIAHCTQQGTASANYSVYLQGDLYDFTKLKWVSGFNHVDTILTQVTYHVYCPGGPTYANYFYDAGTTTVVVSFSGLTTADKYYFFTTMVVDVAAQASDGGTATAKVSLPSGTLYQIDCSVCG